MSGSLLPAPAVSRKPLPRDSTTLINKIHHTSTEQYQPLLPTSSAQSKKPLYEKNFPEHGLPYIEYVRAIAGTSPSLGSIYTTSFGSPKKVDVMILDIKNDGSYLNLEIFGNSESIVEYLDYGHHPPDLPTTPEAQLDSNYQPLIDFLGKPKPSEVAVRLIFVEDLSLATIEALGSTLNLDPHFFAKHLAGANYEHNATIDSSINKARPQEKSAKRTFDMGLKGYLRCSWNRRALGLANLEVIPRERTQKGNIYRPYASLENPSPQPIGEEFDQKLDPDDTIPGIIMAEERVSFLTKDDNHGWTGIFLFDPLREKVAKFPLPKSTKGGATERTLRYRVLHGFNCRNIQRIQEFNQFTISQGTQIGNGFKIQRTRNEFIEHLIRMRDNTCSDGKICACGNSLNVNDSSTFIHLVFHFMLYDWDNVLDDVGGFLDEVDTQMSNNVILQEKLVTWRVVFGNLRKTLVEDNEKIKAILGAIDTYNIGKLEADFRDILNRIDAIKDRTEKTFGALMSSIAIVESQRAISQAESICRLSELAFFFIPLSFATSVFGMQIPGWSENYKPFMWPLVSVSLVLGSYLSRIFVRSRFFHRTIDRIEKNVREYTGLAPGVPIPTIYYFYRFMYFLDTSFPFIYIILGGVGLVLIWTLGGEILQKILATICIFLCPIFIIAMSWS